LEEEFTADEEGGVSNPFNKIESIYGKTEVHSDDEETIWLMSYADLMTLLFTFFVMLYSSVIRDESENLRKALSSYIQGGDAQGGPATGISAAEIVDQLKNYLSERILDEQLTDDVKIGVNNHELTITFSSSLLFDLGSSELRADANKPLDEVTSILSEKAKSMRIRVEGYTDDNPISTSRFHSNWELSGARAAHIVSLLEAKGFPSDHLLIVGYGSSRPLAPNRTTAGVKNPEGQRLNRRVILTVYRLPERKSVSDE
jgi:chemotaxis protein MotB